MMKSFCSWIPCWPAWVHEAGAAIESALTALRNDDIELARSVVARDSQIDASEHEIEHRCLQLLLRQQPVASDLRKVVQP